MKSSSKTKLAYLVSHPIQYQAPLLRQVAQNDQIDLTALFMSDFSVRAYEDPGFGKVVTWDVPLTEGYKHEFLPCKGPDLPLTSTRPYSIGIKEALVRGQYDAIWLHGYAHWTNIRAILIAKKLGIKVFVRAESQSASVEGEGLQRVIKEAIIRKLFKKVDAFLAIGTNNKNYYLRYGVPEEKIFMVPYAVDNDFFKEKAELARPNREELRASLGLEPGRPIILYASKISGRKHGDHLLEAYKKLSPDGVTEPKPYLVYIGTGEILDSLKEEAAKTKWSSIKFLGFKNQTELPALFDLCDVFVLPSVREQWGLIVNELMNASKPIVVTDEVGCAADLVQNGVNGYTFKAGDIDMLSDVINKVVSDPENAARMGAKSLEIISKWGFKENIDGLLAAIEYSKKTK